MATKVITRQPVGGLYLDVQSVRRRSTPRSDARGPLITPKPSPKTKAEWKAVLADIKRDYVSNKYRSCYTKCNDLIESSKSLVNVERAHLIFIRFYAASAIEMQVRTLQTSSSRTKLLLQAREHYRVASHLITTESASPRSPRESRSFSPVPSLRSSRIPSPSPSLSSLDSCLKSPAAGRKKPKKRVAFIDVPAYEPVIRPDSPTLGFEDDWLSPPSSPVAKPRLSSTVLPLPSPTLSIASTTSSLSEAPPSPLVDGFLGQAYSGLLAALEKQVAAHLAWLDADITDALAPQPVMTTDEMRTLELRTRIERLRATGWARKRFDPTRYDALRESALADI